VLKALLLTSRCGGRVKKPSFCPDCGNLWSKYAPNPVLTVKDDGFIPTGFNHSAQRWTTESAYAGCAGGRKNNPKRVESIRRHGDATPLGL
jgi:hypothetical protein